MYRVNKSPLQVRNIGFMGINSHSDNWYNHRIKTSLQFIDDSYTIINYAPQNNPPKMTSTIGIGLDSNGPSVSASVSYDHDDLSIISNTKTALRRYETVYNYNSHRHNTNSYLAGDVYAYGMVQFRKTSGIVHLEINHEIQYYGHSWYGYGDVGKSTLKAIHRW